MCCGCGNQCGTCTGNIVYVLEKLASFVALTAVVVCIMTTIAISLGVGVGLGYNYCFVDLKVTKGGGKTDTSEKTNLRTADEEVTEKTNYRRSQVTPTIPRGTLPIPAIKHTMVIPLNGAFDFPSLIEKLRGRNKNVTLELIM